MDQNAVEYIRNHIKEFLPPEYQDADVIVEPVLKNNDRVLTRLTIFKEGSNMAPTVYKEPYWEEIKRGRPLSSVLEEIAQIQLGENNRGTFDLSMLKDYEKVKPKLFIRMCDPEKNTEYLRDKPYTACGELAVSYRIQVLEEKEMNGSAAITNEVLRSWGITKEQLHQDAVQAEKERKQACLYRMDDILFSEQAENLLEEGAPLQAGELPIFVLTNRDKSEGAGVMVQDGVLKKVGELLGADYYVLPSSIHEVLVLPDNGEMDVKELESMVRDVNAAEVAPHELLSDKVQFYDRASRTLGRKQEKGILGRLAENKKQIQEKAGKEKVAEKRRNEPSM